MQGLKGRNAQGSGRYESWITWTGMPFSWASCNAVTWGGETCSQRPRVSSETSETDTLQRSLFFFFLQLFFPTATKLPHTHNVMNSHLSPGYSPSGVKVWHHSHLRWLYVTVLLFGQIFPVPFLIPHMTTNLTQWARMVRHFPCRGWKIFLLICPLASSALAQFS